jgi:hypothetical protein
MPFQFKVRTSVHFWARFLQIVFAEAVLAELRQPADVVDRLSLAGGHHCHAARRALVTLHGLAQTFLHRLPPVGQNT